MKWLAFIVLPWLVLTGYAQTDSVSLHINTPVRKKNDNLKIIGVYAASIILNGIGDGLNNSNQKTLGHAINALSIGMLVASPFVFDYDKKKWYWYLLTYTSLRIGLFDSTYNLTTNQPMRNTGTTSPTDIIYNRLGLNPDIPRPLFLAIGITIPLVKL